MKKPHNPWESNLDDSDLGRYDPSLHYAYTRSQFKTASLFFDRIYIDLFDWRTLKFSMDESAPEELFYANSRITGAIAHHMTRVNSPVSYLPIYENEAEAFSRGVMIEAKRAGVVLTPMYGTVIDNESWGDESTRQSDGSVLKLSLSGFPCVSEMDLKWEQVLEFRGDDKSIRNLRATRALLAELSKYKTTAETQEKTAELIENYQNACRKHGVGLYSSLFDQIYDKSTLIASAGVAIMSGSISAAIAAGAMKIAKDCAVTIESHLRSGKELETTHRSGAAALSLRTLSEDIAKKRLNT
jgi:hypothetical protein